MKLVLKFRIIILYYERSERERERASMSWLACHLLSREMTALALTVDLKDAPVQLPLSDTWRGPG